MNRELGKSQLRSGRRKRKYPSEPKLAIAMRYRPDINRAPWIAAKGAGILAEKILEIARENDIPVRQDKNLIQVLSRLDLNDEIPPELFQVVARILTFVYRTAHSFRREMADSYSRLGDHRKEQQNNEGARRSWETAYGIYRDLGLSGEAEFLRHRIESLT